jgi:hypothetical protein
MQRQSFNRSRKNFFLKRATGFQRQHRLSTRKPSISFMSAWEHLYGLSKNGMFFRPSRNVYWMSLLFSSPTLHLLCMLDVSWVLLQTHLASPVHPSMIIWISHWFTYDPSDFVWYGQPCGYACEEGCFLLSPSDWVSTGLGIPPRSRSYAPVHAFPWHLHTWCCPVRPLHQSLQPSC